MKNVLVVFGGQSVEHDVSIITAHIPIMDSLTASGDFKIWPLYIAKDGSWYCDDSLYGLDNYRLADFQDSLKSLSKVRLLFDDGLWLIWPGLREKKQKIDVVFPAMHGTYGEDGSLMGLLRLASVPFVGCDMQASVVAMDKVLTKQATESAGVPSVPYVWLTNLDWQNDKLEVMAKIKKLQLPLFVKPVHLGSSIAITRVEKQADLENAIEVALHYDDKVIVEEGVENLIEVTLPIMGNDDALQLALVEQPLAKFFDFEEKYLKSGKTKGSSGGVNSGYSKIPADIDAELMNKVKAMGELTYKAIGASGIARIDFLIDGKKREVYMNEVNTLPGSLYHHNWRQAGVSAVELVTELVRLAEERFKKNRKKVFTFSSDILKYAGKGKGNG